jgi:DNA helicase II / ATP-dependent DNA helicase PcrA
MRHREGLNKAQLEAVLATEGPLLVLAGAGTGKTRVVTCRIAEIVSKGTPPKAVCAVTFTNKAAAEMRERALKMLGQKPSSKDGPVVSTFHSLGVRILREFGTEIGVPKTFVVADDADQTEIAADALRDLGVGRDQMRPRDGRFKISAWKNAGLTPDQALDAATSLLEEKLAHAYARYEEETARRGLVDFDDLILKPLRLLSTKEDVARALQERFRYLLVDEYQDTNAVQYGLVRHLAGERRNVCVVGDDDQSIYGWRGAEPDRILAFSKDFRGAKTVVLEENYRSTNVVLRAANRVIANNPVRAKKTLRSSLGDGDKIRLYVARDDKDECDEVGRSVARLVKAQGTPLREIAVLFRANRQCRPLEQALRLREIPYRVVGTRSFFDRREIRDVLAYARVASNPKDDGAWLRVANTPPRGIGKTSIDKLKSAAGAARRPLREVARACGDVVVAKAAEGCATLEAALEALVARAATKGVSAALTALIDDVQYRDFLRMEIQDPLDLAARQKALDELIESAKEFEARSSDRTLAAFLESLALKEDDRRDDKEDERPLVSLLTMHAAKGLEFVHVFVVGLEDGILPHKNSIAEPDENDDAPVDAASRGLEEERRLFYVALTRARRRLYLSRAAKRVRYGREESRVPSRFLEEMGTEDVEVMDATSDQPATAEYGKAMLAELKARFAKRAGGGAGS